MYKEYVLEENVDIIITDSPPILGLLYYNEQNERIKQSFQQYIIEAYKSKNTLNILLKRVKKYNPVGRNQSEDESRKLDQKIEQLLIYNNIPYYNVKGNKEGLQQVFNMIIEYKNIKEKDS